MVKRVWPVQHGSRGARPAACFSPRRRRARWALLRAPRAECPEHACVSTVPRHPGNQASKKHDLEDVGFVDDSEQAQSGPATKKARVDYSAFKADVSRLQKNLEDFENDLKEHSMQVQQKLAFILNALDEAAVPPQAPAAASNGGLLPMAGAQDLQQHGATADALTAAAATAMPSSSSPPVDAEAAGENGAASAAATTTNGSDGAAGSTAAAQAGSSSRNLAAAYLSAAGHTNPADVLGGGLPGSCGLPNGLPNGLPAGAGLSAAGLGAGFGPAGLASAAGLLGAATGPSQPLGGLSAAGLSAINSAANLPLGLQAQRLQLGRHGGAMGQMQTSGSAAASAAGAAAGAAGGAGAVAPAGAPTNGEARRYEPWWGDGWGAMPAGGGDGLGLNGVGGGLNGLNGGQNGNVGMNGALHSAINGANNGVTPNAALLPDEQQKKQLAMLHGLQNGNNGGSAGGALPNGLDGHHSGTNGNGNLDLKRLLAAQAQMGAGKEGHSNGHTNGHTNGHAKLEAQELQEVAQA